MRQSDVAVVLEFSIRGGRGRPKRKHRPPRDNNDDADRLERAPSLGRNHGFCGDIPTHLYFVHLLLLSRNESCMSSEEPQSSLCDILIRLGSSIVL